MSPRTRGRGAAGGAGRAPGRRPAAAARPWALARGATVVPGGVRFDVWAPRARQLAVRIYDGHGAVVAEQPLEPGERDTFGGTMAGVGAGADYRFVLDGERETADPVSRWQPYDVFGPSRVVDPHAFAWTDGAWRGVAREALVIYELHVGTFSDAGTFDGVIPYLAGLRELGVTAIELMPVAEFPGGRNWGYDGVHLYAPESSYGGPEGLRRLVDAAHAAGLAVLLDVVYNHTGPEGSVLHEFGPYFVDKYHTPWGGAANVDDADSDEVRRFIVDNARYWVTEYHLDGLRLDATDQIYDFSARHVLEELASAVHAQAAALGRRILVTAETAANDPRWVRPPARGGFGMDAQWLDDFHHGVRTAVTDERGGYYADFHGVGSLAKCYRDRYVYDGGYSAHLRRRRGAPAYDVPASRFVAFIQNHDQVGNRARGERLVELTSFAQLKLAAMALLVSPFVPLLFMGEEYGEPHPFLYFVSHQSPALVQAVRDGRREEFRSFAWQGEIPDPAAEETFHRSKLDRDAAHGPEHVAVRALYAALLRLRRERGALRPGTEPVVLHDAEAGWIVLLHDGATPAPLLAALNFAGEPRSVPLAGAPAGRWRKLLATDDVAFAGAGATPDHFDHTTSDDATVTIPAHAGAVYELETV
ncbi:MAG TPA: malto-oligosyltrehalose trehalohydrolase [Gemmatimonadaceae bacterium]|nr:malto-oligosyltrehalose trehalohydrolase [Gemmatimonadaceae bacterium]